MKVRRIPLTIVVLGAALLPSRLHAQQPAGENPGPDTVHFASPRGAVTFTHGKHAQLSECAACHHESRPERPLESPRQRCSACHTEPATAPVKTSAKGAMHDTVKKEGVCYSCHAREAAAGKAVPGKCADCHIKEGGS